MLDLAEKNSQTWFKTKYTRDVLKAFYNPCIKFSKDKEGNLKPYPPTLKVNLRQVDGKFDATLYDVNKKPMKDIPMEEVLVKGAQVTMLIECTGIWFSGSTSFGLSWKAVQIRVDEIPESIRDYAFDDEDGSAAPKKAAAVAPKPAPKPASNQFAGLDDDDDEEIDDEVALAPAPVPAPAPAPAADTFEDEDDAFDEVAPAPVPVKKAVLTKRKIVATAKKA